ncbi:PEP-CTERM sorting domain-containing protein [Nitrosospira multiformis]|uniref:PEP-CTERM sorting domain-containing protein n=1 Tax=Nitrosospira multiformis TaxID=1231 RepID=UPI000899570D|nr:PEP-CTERM sorting domain-containing protein [Nitrosospira multiformis]SEA47463.1 PEP-CTERM protein-sorting domain-containing protein [Nitrosospira multiformis]
MVDLNTLLDIPRGVILTDATGINNNGQGIAIAETSVPIPEPETYALMLVGLSLVGLWHGVKGCRIWLSIIDSALLQKNKKLRAHCIFQDRSSNVRF